MSILYISLNNKEIMQYKVIDHNLFYGYIKQLTFY